MLRRLYADIALIMAEIKKRVEETPVKRVVLSEEDICNMAPALRNHRKLVRWLMHVIKLDRVNAIHDKYFDEPGAPFVANLLKEWDIKIDIDGQEILDNLPQGPFITVSNHPFGALDGIMLIHIFASRRPDYKVMVNMILANISAMKPNFISVDSMASDDPDKQAVSRQGIREVIKRIKEGHPVGFFPAGAISKVNWRLRLKDRQWQPTVIRLIEKLKVPVIPVFFHGTNSWFFNFLGVVDWRLRTLRLPSEVFNKDHKTMRISIGKPISVEEQRAHSSNVEELGEYLRQQTYALRDRKKKK